MSQKRNSAPIGRMTWGRALPVLIVCAVFDALRLLFGMFWFFGPALAALYCTSTAGGWVGSLGGLTATACTAAAALGFYGFALSATFGTVMAMAVGLFGWGTVTLILAITNPRIWKSNVRGWIWSVFALGISEVPLLGTIPMLTITHWRLYMGQIKTDKTALKQYRKEQDKITASVQMQEQNRQTAELMQTRAAQLVQNDIY